MPRRPAALTASAALALLLAACSSPHSAVPDDEIANPAPDTEAVATEPTPEPRGNIQVTVPVSDAEGRTGTVTVWIDPIQATSDIVNAAPGTTDVSVLASFIGQVLNTTPGRSFEVQIFFEVYAIYPDASPVCAAEDGSNGVYCLVHLGVVSGIGELQPDMRVALSDEVTIASPWRADVPEAEAPGLIDQIKHPLGYAVGQSNQWIQIQATCVFQSDYFPFERRLVVAPAELGCG